MCPQIEYGTQSVSIDDRTTKVDNRLRLKTWTIIKVTQSVVSKSGLTVQFFFRIFKISSKFVEVASGFFSSPDSVFIFFCDRGVSTTCSRKRFRLLGAALLGELSAISPSSTSGSCVSSTSEFTPITCEKLMPPEGRRNFFELFSIYRCSNLV